ncbi:hypothetical protein METP1_02008 [Methanosarcinales archaeon]|nr:hypothetical protein METP1_02008 [Methanosarcinales archaeon]
MLSFIPYSHQMSNCFTFAHVYMFEHRNDTLTIFKGEKIWVS